MREERRKAEKKQREKEQLHGMAILGKNWTAMLPGGVKLEMIWVDPGTFIMGYGIHDADGGSVHQVTLTKGYWIGKYQFTQGQWKAVGVSKKEACFRSGDRLPVEEVNWGEIIECCEQLNGQLSDKLPSGYHFALPTEAQWEFAARGGVKSRGYEYSGSDNIDEVAWYGRKDRTHVVGRKRPNELGIYDMSGNVWECCSDWYSFYACNDEIDPVGPPSDDYLARVCRGGSVGNVSDCCRLTFRYYYDPLDCGYLLGFRMALVPVE